MCIRDSLYDTVHAIVLPVQAIHIPLDCIVPAFPGRSHKIIICLLYTSDAADDLLCVDLGGRRIIKKKNKKKKNNTQ